MQQNFQRLLAHLNASPALAAALAAERREQFEVCAAGIAAHESELARIDADMAASLDAIAHAEEEFHDIAAHYRAAVAKLKAAVNARHAKSARRWAIEEAHARMLASTADARLAGIIRTASLEADAARSRFASQERSAPTLGGGHILAVVSNSGEIERTVAELMSVADDAQQLQRRAVAPEELDAAITSLWARMQRVAPSVSIAA